MKLNSFSDVEDSKLLLIARSKTQHERNITLEIIEILREIYRRRLHLKRGFSSLHSYCVEELKYSDGAAFRRIKAMKLVEDMPEAKVLIAQAQINLTTACELQVALEANAKQDNPVSREIKLELLEKLKGKSKRETQKVVAQLNPTVVQNKEIVRFLANEQVKVEIIIDTELFNKIEKLRTLTSHKNNSIRDLLESLVNSEIEKRNRLQKLASPAKLLKVSPPHSMNKRYVPAFVRRKVWERDQGKCAFIDLISKKTCDSRRRLQFEHIHPFALGGASSLENLKLLCANHNRLQAISVFGENHMAKFSNI